MSAYQTIEGTSIAEVVEKKSRFIAHLRHVDSEEEALSFLQEIRHEHAQARHNVYAYLLKGGRARYSDDGEPAQTAGIPTYEALCHAHLIDVICVTTRYFGGTLLGTGGLVRAYTDACQKAIEGAQIVRIETCIDVIMEITYSLYQNILGLVHAEGAKVISTDFADNVTMTLRLLSSQKESFVQKITEVSRGQANIAISEPFDAPL